MAKITYFYLAISNKNIGEDVVQLGLSSIACKSTD